MNRKAAVAAVAWVPPIVVEFHELRLGDLGMPYTRYFRLLPPWVRKLLLIAAFIVAWDHFINHDN